MQHLPRITLDQANICLSQLHGPINELQITQLFSPRHARSSSTQGASYPLGHPAGS